MKICFLVSSMGAGGAERVAATLCNGWVARGYQVTLIATYSNRGNCAYILDPGVNFIYLADQISQSSFRFLLKISRFLSLRKFLKSQSPDVIISFLTNVNVAVLLATIGYSTPVIVSERIHPPQNFLGWPLEFFRKLTYPFASRVVMLTEKSLQWMNTNIKPTHSVVIPNPLVFPLAEDFPLRSPFEYFSESANLLLSAGRLVSQKQFDHLIRAFSTVALKYPNWNLAIVGEGPLLENLLELTNSLNLADRIKFIGRVGNMGDWYSRADLYVLSSRFEGFPNTLAEAMAYGCVAVSYDCDTGPRDIITSGSDGVLVPAGDEIALAAAIAGLMSDKNARERMADAAKSVRIRFALPQILDKWDKLFATL